jgi:hypothetical protein
MAMIRDIYRNPSGICQYSAHTIEYRVMKSGSQYAANDNLYAKTV